MSVVIETDDLGKCYRISHEAVTRYATLRDSLMERMFGTGGARKQRQQETFWALRDVELEIREGERVGIIGRNGAGKSTLLKLLSRITEPSTGKIRLRGRVSSLLEVGTGFHPELTGRENVYLNGAILGMSRRDIGRRFDEIVEFAEVERFLDTPVKRYSSGMYMRLAFAVAAHLEPDVLLVDEVLAVGDAEFQAKCLGKMSSVADQGRTILFVSHNMNAIERLCGRCLHIDTGALQNDSTDVLGVISGYLDGNHRQLGRSEWVNTDNGFRKQAFQPTRLALTDQHGATVQMPLRNNQPCWVTIEGIIEQLDPLLQIGFAVYDEKENLLFWSFHTDMTQENWPRLVQGRNVLRAEIPARLLNQGVYRLCCLVSLYQRTWVLDHASGIAVTHNIRGGLSDSPYWMEKRPGYIAPVLKWKAAGSDVHVVGPGE